MTEDIYYVNHWRTRYENAQSRRCTTIGWIAVPNKQDGAGFRRIAAHERATDIFAAWILILQVASKCVNRGVLISKTNVAYDAEDMSFMTGFNEDIFELSFNVLSTERIAWLGVCSEPALSEVIAAHSVNNEKLLEKKRNEKKRKEEPREDEVVESESSPANKKPDDDALKGMVKKPLSDSESFMTIWCEWIMHRKEIGKRLTQTSVTRQMNELLALNSVNTAVATVENSIKNGYQGLVTPNNSRYNGKKTDERRAQSF